MKQQEDARWLFERTGTICDGHFVLRSGRHTRRYVDFGGLDRNCRSFALQLGWVLAGRTAAAGIEYEVVITPAGDAEILAVAIAAFHVPHLPTAFASKIEGHCFRLASDAVEVVRGKRVLLADDIMTSGGTFGRLAAAVGEAGGIVVGRSVVWRRSPPTGDAVVALIDEEIPDFAPGPATCPACREGMPLEVAIAA